MLFNKRVINTSLFLAWKNLLKNKKITLLTLFIISIGFISAVTMAGILKDLSSNTEQMYIDSLYGHIILEPLEEKELIENVDLLKRKISTIPQVTGVVAIQKVSGTLYDHQGNKVVSEFWIVDSEDLGEVTEFDDLLFEGDYLNKKNVDGIYTGCVNTKFCTMNEGEDNVDVDIGENMKIVFGTGEEVDLKLKGTYRHMMYTIEKIVFINEKTAESILDNYDKNKANLFLIKLEDEELTSEVISELSYLGIGAEIISHDDKVKAQIKMVEDFNAIGFVSFLIGVIISIITIYIILYINILNKGRQIGIIRAVGIGSNIIILSYVLQGFFYGIGGSILGVTFSLLVKTYFDFYPMMTAHGPVTAAVSVGYYISTFITMIITSSITGYYVSKKETQKNILEAVLNG